MGDGFEEWYASAWRPVLRGVIAGGVPREEAEEAAAEGFARALGAWGRVAHVASPEAWVYRVALNVAKRRARRAGLERRLHEGGNAGVVASPGDADPVWTHVARLPARQREAIVLRYVVDLQQDAIAMWMGVRPGTVAASLHAARATLRAAMQEEKQEAARE